VARIGERSAYRVLVGKPEGKRPLRRATSRWENNIKVVRKEIGSERMD
jgi:hypothetical protein